LKLLNTSLIYIIDTKPIFVFSKRPQFSFFWNIYGRSIDEQRINIWVGRTQIPEDIPEDILRYGIRPSRHYGRIIISFGSDIEEIQFFLIIIRKKSLMYDIVDIIENRNIRSEHLIIDTIPITINLRYLIFSFIFKHSYHMHDIYLLQMRKVFLSKNTNYPLLRFRSVFQINLNREYNISRIDWFGIERSYDFCVRLLWKIVDKRSS